MTYEYDMTAKIFTLKGCYRDENFYIKQYASSFPIASMPISDSRNRFNGKEDQAFTGLPFSDYGARMYDPERGRWLSQDPLQQYHSLYVFCGSNPINNIDVDGNWSISNHYVMTMKSLALYGITGQQAKLLSYYASMYADNPKDKSLLSGKSSGRLL